MAQVDVQWPSEEEDFDAVTDENNVNKTSVATEEPSNKPEPTKPESIPVSDVSSVPAQQETEPSPSTTAEMPEAQPVDKEPSTPPTVTSSSTGGKKAPWLRLAAEIVLVLVVAGLGYYATSLASDNKDLKAQVTKLNENPQLAVQRQTDDILRKVGALMQLPKGEAPTVASVSDAEQAKKQSDFFKNAQNGDKVLMYVKAGQAILYRPSTNKIVLVAPLTFNNDAAAATTGSSTTAKPSTSSTSSTTNR
jgi:hypothetical protein